MTAKKATRYLAGLLFAIGVIWLMKALGSMTTMILVSVFLAYIIDPLVKRLEERGLPRSAAGLLLLLGVALFLLVLILVIVPSILVELSVFVLKAPEYVTILVSKAINFLKQLGISTSYTREESYAFLWQKAQEILPSISLVANYAAQFFSTIFKSTFRALGTVLQVLLVPVLAYYFLSAFDAIKRAGAQLIPPDTRESVLAHLREIDHVIAGFVRGQLTICLILAFLYTLGFTLIGIDLPVVLGMTSGALFIIPYVGTMVGVVGGSLMALAKFGTLDYVAYVVVWIAAVQLVESYVLTPRIVGQAIGLHPLAYILAIMAGAQLFGFLGMLLAIPVAAVLKVLLKTAMRKYLESDLYSSRTETQ
ncbi:MAG: AI-2E family transporter [Pseudomonadota bacterium]